MIIRLPRNALSALTAAVLVTACGGAEERKAEHLQRGQSYFEAHNYDKAKVEFKNVLQIDPKTAAAYFYLGQIEESKQQWPEAFGFYQKAAELDPADLDVKTKLTRFYVLAKDRENAEAVLKDLLQAKPEDIDVRLLKAAVDNLKGETEAAITELNAIVQEQPTRADAYLILAMLYQNQNDGTAVLRILQQGLNQNAGNPMLLVNLAKAYLQQKQAAKAEEILRQLIAADPAAVEYRNMLVQLLIQQERLADAEQALRASIAAKPDDIGRYLTLAEFLTRAGASERAAVELNAAISAHPGHASLSFALARLYEQTRQLQKAEATYKDIMEKFAGKADEFKAKDHLAELIAARGRVDEAGRMIDEVLKENPQDRLALLLQGKIALSKKDAQKAIAAFRAILKDQPESVEALTLLAKAHMQDGKPALAQESLERAVLAKPEDFATHRRLAEFLVQQKNTALALEKVDGYLRIDPKSLEAWNLKADLLALEKRAPELETVLVKMKNDFPDKAVGSLRLGNFYQAQKKYAAALAEYEASLSRADNDYEPLGAIVGVYMQMGEPEKALARLKKVLSENPKHPTVHQLLAMYYGGFNQEEEAIKSLRQAIQANPGWPLPYTQLAGLYGKNGQSAQAREIYAEALKVFPEDPNVLLGMARLDEEGGNYPMAIKRYETILERNPDNIMVINNLVSLLSADAAQTANLDRARELAAELEDSKEPAFMDTLAWLDYQTGRYDQALARLKEVVGEQGEVPIFQYHLGMAYYKRGDKASAKDHLEKAIAAGQGFDGMEEAKAILKTL